MAFLTLVRHGQSRWNLENRFTGWTDVPLTDAGRHEAERAGHLLHDIPVDHAFTSLLGRAQETLAIILGVLHRDDVPITKDAALNERDYGDLTGMNKDEAAARFGAEQVHDWRRSWDTRPPGGESLADTDARAYPFFRDQILPLVAGGEDVARRRPRQQPARHRQGDRGANTGAGRLAGDPYCHAVCLHPRRGRVGSSTRRSARRPHRLRPSRNRMSRMKRANRVSIADSPSSVRKRGNDGDRWA